MQPHEPLVLRRRHLLDRVEFLVARMAEVEDGMRVRWRLGRFPSVQFPDDGQGGGDGLALGGHEFASIRANCFR